MEIDSVKQLGIISIFALSLLLVSNPQAQSAEKAENPAAYFSPSNWTQVHKDIASIGKEIELVKEKTKEATTRLRTVRTETDIMVQSETARTNAAMPGHDPLKAYESFGRIERAYAIHASTVKIGAQILDVNKKKIEIITGYIEAANKQLHGENAPNKTCLKTPPPGMDTKRCMDEGKRLIASLRDVAHKFQEAGNTVKALNSELAISDPKTIEAKAAAVANSKKGVEAAASAASSVNLQRQFNTLKRLMEAERASSIESSNATTKNSCGPEPQKVLPYFGGKGAMVDDARVAWEICKSGG